MRLPIVIVGAGLSGLALASRLRLSRPDITFRIFEAGPRPGGVVGTRAVGGYLIEQGPNGFLDNNPTTLTLARDLGLGPRLVPASEGSRKNRYVFWKGKVQPFPRGLTDLLFTPLLSIPARLRLLCEPFVPGRRRHPLNESITDLMARRVGVRAAEVFADAFVTGIFGGDYRQLEGASCLPRVAAMEHDAGSLFAGFNAASRIKKAQARERGEEPQPTRMWSFRGGLQELVDAMVAKVGGALQSNRPVRNLSRVDSGWRVTLDGEAVEAERVALCCPPTVMARLLREVAPPLADELAAIRSNRIAVVALGFDRSAVREPRDGFGFLVPQAQGLGLLGVQWCSAIFPGRAPEGKVLWRALCGGWTRADLLDRSDAEIIADTVGELKAMGEIRGEPELAEVIRWDPAIPQYLKGHAARRERIEVEAGKLPGLILLGNGLRGVAMNDVVGQVREKIGPQIAQMTAD